MVAIKDHSYVFNFPVSFYNYTRYIGCCYCTCICLRQLAYTSCWQMYVLLAYLTSSWRGCIIVVLFATHPTLGDNNPAAAGSIAMELHRFRLKVCLYPASCIWKIYGLLGIHLLIFGKYIYSYRDDFTRLYTTYLLSLLLTKRLLLCTSTSPTLLTVKVPHPTGGYLVATILHG